jgi:hypothetical protein
MTIKMNRGRRRWTRRTYAIAAATATLGLMALAVSLLISGTTTPATAAKGGIPGSPEATSAASMQTGRVTRIDVSATNSAFGAPVGTSTANGSMDSVDSLSPSGAATFTPSNLFVQLNSSVDSTTVVGLTWEGGSFTCSVPAGNDTCINTSSGPSIPPLVHIAVKVTPSAPPGYTGDMLFGYQLNG